MGFANEVAYMVIKATLAECFQRQKSAFFLSFHSIFQFRLTNLDAVTYRITVVIVTLQI